jgi:hypothetical protein
MEFKDIEFKKEEQPQHLKGVTNIWEVDNEFKVMLDETQEFKHLRISRLDNSDSPIGFHTLQSIKNKVWGKNCQAIQVYPSNSDLIDYGNTTHLWTYDGIDTPNLKELYSYPNSKEE